MNICCPRGAALASAGLLLVVGTTSCGSDDDSGRSRSADPAIESLSEKEFVDRGNKLCTTNGKAVAARFEAMSEPPKPAELTAAYDNMIKESYKITGDLLALGAPAGREKELVDLIVEMHRVTVAVDGKGAEAFFADHSDPWQSAVDSLVDDFGLTACRRGQ